MIKLLATALHISNGSIVHDVQWFGDAQTAELAALRCADDLKAMPGIVDWTVTLADMTERDQAGTEILHMCLDDAQPYYEHRMGWRDNYDVARQIQARRRALMDVDNS